MEEFIRIIDKLLADNGDPFTYQYLISDDEEGGETVQMKAARQKMEQTKERL